MTSCTACNDTYYVCKNHPDRPWDSGCCPPPVGAVCSPDVGCVRGPGTVCPSCTPPARTAAHPGGDRA